MDPNYYYQLHPQHAVHTVTPMGLPPNVQTPMASTAYSTAPQAGTSRSNATGDQATQKKVKSKEEKKKKKALVRMAGGTVWTDPTLEEWDPNDFRLFCGDLGNDVSDEVLTRAFNKYPSFVKARVVRDKRTNKSKGFGFVSFKDPQDFIRAMRDMNGKYVGSRPIKLRKSNWKDRNAEIVKKKQKDRERLGLI